ncbi:hypothetical protein [Tissierella praeacuta]|uniref:Uncharacterized protein n=1 Tax=Tissierella praeacuta DSM 18095 TaxID=1123404 RepID=A0A1M4YDP1_9FIRM|nr:hypothetical protein [Tissierella praeacuta]MBU5256275.1 hypothetical protein [Tissierella praeacuta]TCU74203.1 hypothetical protein EV204_104241 [Tissierella praeacuta]SHF03576.1 hypothetical protein SAMN02745784_02605 [Tissierella praeacuta DSM 18095]SUP03177.1 Uncharacterised protein [Tissierella praeacuta]
MNKIMLISKLNPQDYTEEKKKIFFSLGGMNIPTIENKIIDVLHKSGLVGLNDIVLKYNGIELNITTQQIPSIVRLLCNENISIYSIYQFYNPDL